MPYTVIFSTPATGAEVDGEYETRDQAEKRVETLIGEEVFFEGEMVGLIDRAWVVSEQDKAA